MSVVCEEEEDGSWSRGSVCDRRSSLRHNSAYEQDSKVQFVIDAVYAFAYALQQLKNDVCPLHRGMCQDMKMVDGGFFYKNYLLKTSFIGMK